MNNRKIKLDNLTQDLKKHPITYVLKKYQLTWQELIRIQEQRYNKENETGKYINYNKNNNTYYITKTINEKTIYYGQYQTRHEAQTIVDELIQVNWNKNTLPIIHKKTNITTYKKP